MDQEVFDLYIEAGKIASRVRSAGVGVIRVGAGFLETVETIEAMVTDTGAGLAFPLNISLNEDAAHDTASTGDGRVFREGDVVKLDLGVHLDGYVADTATTIDLGDRPMLIEASREALAGAIRLVRPGTTVGQLGEAIQKEITRRGFLPVVNLTGHGLGRYIIHSPPNIPNIAISGGATLEAGMVFAIEPFASTGSGHVSEKPRTEIYQQILEKPIRMPQARKILDSVRPRKGLPFAKRWLPGTRLDIPLSTLVREQILHAYPVLSDIPGSYVSQHEHTIIVTEDGCIVTTA
ncbi:methionyl aminopeptidase [Methanolinea mesophila]|uniref:type II methionyl aminopeptidase n=1 Tax=Methanolinea mesophila TaxID=547055 RepID=UPI001AEA3BCE|nr:type II methionyl aminopeptidase [Methanolinea mesophila]MBP1928579.1 methionyl aminopeptidase [Methanolinea mesophila]